MVESDILRVKDSDLRIEAVQELTEKLVQELGLSHSEELQMLLLAEETLGLAKGMTDTFDGKFWLEGEGRKAAVCLELRTDMDADRKAEFLSVSRSGKNEYAKGFARVLSDLLENIALTYTESTDLQLKYTGTVAAPDLTGTGIPMQHAFVPQWSLADYRKRLQEQGEEAQPAWDELEKSIIARLADDVTVSVHAGTATLKVIRIFE